MAENKFRSTYRSEGAITLHADPDCYRLQSSNRVREVDPETLTEFHRCPSCHDDVQEESQGNPDWSYQRALRQAGKEGGANA